MRKTVDPVRGIVIGTLVMQLVAVPRSIASWSEQRSGAYSSLWFIWPMIGFGLAAMENLGTEENWDYCWGSGSD